MSQNALKWLSVVLLGSVGACYSKAASLTVADAKLLLTNTPDYISAKSKGRCPEVELGWHDENEAVFQLRSMCPTSGSGLLGNYTVDLRSGQVWVGIDRDQLVRSSVLRQALSKIRRKK